MSWWMWVLVVAAVWLVMGCFVAALWAVGRQSHERRGVIRFDTPHGRSALRRCNPARDVHYFAAGEERCECGDREGNWGLTMPVIVDPRVMQPCVVRTDDWPPEPHLLLERDK